MKIGIDARLYGPEKQKGLGRYVQKLVQELEHVVILRCAQDDRNNIEFIIFLRKDNWNEYQPKKSNFKKVLADYRWYSFIEQIMMPIKIWQEKIDLMHFPHFNVPILCPVNFVVTIHDLILQHFSDRRASTLNSFLYLVKNLIYKIIIFIAIKRSKKIITVSEFTKKDILNLYNINSNKIQVIYNGIINKISSFNNIKKFNISKPYFLYVGNAYPHKNLEKLILAFDNFKNMQLVLVGELDYFYKRLKNKIKNKNIIFTNFVSDQELASLYKNASLYVFPSLYEGFGLPPLEAMSYGLPVVCSNASCLPEILGNAAIYFDPNNIDDIIINIKYILNNKKIKNKLISAGYQRIKLYSWQKMAEEILEIYNSCLTKK